MFGTQYGTFIAFTCPNVLNFLGNSLLPDPNCVLIDHLGCLVAGDTFDLFRGASSL